MCSRAGLDVEASLGLRTIQHAYLTGNLGADVKRYGLFHQGELVGVAVYGVPSNPKVITNWLPDLAPVPLGNGKYHWPALVLQRLVLLDWVGGNAESWFVGAAANC